MLKLFKIRDVELICLHQCPYGSVIPKPTGILTNAAWMKAVCLLCHEVREHYHLKGGLVGKAWSYHDDKMVWRTSLAAEYPCGLTVAWSRSLFNWLMSDNGKQWMLERSFSRTGRWSNVLVRSSLLKGNEAAHNVVSDACEKSESNREKRERENREAVGGLRFAKRAVSRSSALRQVGRKLRSVLDRWMTNQLLETLGNDLTHGVPEDVSRLRDMLCCEFNSKLDDGRWPVPLWSKLLHESDDPEMNVLPTWMSVGFPLGIKSEIQCTGIFPKTYEDTAAVESSRLEGVILHDELGEHSNYASFVEAGEKAQSLLDQMVQEGRAVCCNSWDEVLVEAGPDAQLTRMGCIIKTKADGTEKVRLIFDGRRSGVNGLISCRERVTLPRVSDVADGFLQLLANNHNEEIMGLSRTVFS